MKIIVDNQLIEYKDEGSGKVILLLHGWGTSLNTFDQLAKYLSKKFRVIRFDFPGFGNSPKPTCDWFVTDYAKITSDLLQKLKINDLYSVIGHSFGGRVVIKGISSGVLKPEKAILIGTAGVKPNKSAKKIIYKSIAKIGKISTSLPIINKLQPMLKKRLYSAAGSSDYLNAADMKNIFVNVINEDLLPEVSKNTKPTLLIWGKYDNETPLVDANKILNKLKNGKLVIIPNAGHFVYLDNFNEVTTELDNFLS